jgi:dTDP-4-dehydrorhamnose reductase
MADVRTCEEEPERAGRCNTEASIEIARVAGRLGIPLVFVSTDQVFDGAGGWYAESAETSPVNTYGHTKADAERLILQECPTAVVVRLALVIGSSTSARPSGSDQVLRALATGIPPSLFTDEFRTPIHVVDAARIIADLALVHDRPRILHLAGPDRVSRYELGQYLARAAGLDASAIRTGTRSDVKATPRPADVSLDTSLLQSWTDNPPRSIEAAVAAAATEWAERGTERR